MKNKKNNKLKLIVLSALAFVVGAFTLANLPKDDFVALAEELPQQEVQMINSNYIDLMNEGVASGELTTYDYFDTTSPFPKGEQVVLYSFNCNPINIQSYTNAKMWSYLYNLGYINDNDEVVRLSSSIGLSTSQYSNPPYMYYGFPSYNSSNVDQVVSFDTCYRYFNYTTPANLDYYNLYFDRVGGLEGVIFNFPVGLYNYFELLDLGYSAEYLSSYTWINSPYIVQSNNVTGILLEQYRLSEDLFNSINLEFVKLSDLLVYAYNLGVSDGYTDGYNSGYDLGYDEGSTDNSEYLQYGIFSRCDVDFWLDGYADDEGYYDQFSVNTGNLNGGALHFNRFNGYLSNQLEYFAIEDGKVVPHSFGDLYIWENSEVELFFDYQLEYTAPDVYINNVQYLYDIWITYKYADGTTRSFMPVITDGYIEPVNRETGVSETGYLFSIRFKFGLFNPSVLYQVSPADIVDSIYLIDTSPRLNNISYNEGYNQGFNEGKTQGEELGYNQGFREGKTQGFNEGFDKGSSTGNMFFDFVSAIFDVPVQTFLGLFSFEIWGVNLSNFLLSLLGICLVLSCVKFFIGL